MRKSARSPSSCSRQEQSRTHQPRSDAQALLEIGPNGARFAQLLVPTGAVGCARSTLTPIDASRVNAMERIEPGAVESSHRSLGDRAIVVGGRGQRPSFAYLDYDDRADAVGEL